MTIPRFIKTTALVIFTMAVISGGAFGQYDQTGQKGIDTQTTTIKTESNTVTSRPYDARRNIDWGRGKTKVRDMLPNPYKLSGRRDVLMESIMGAMREQKIILDEASSRPKDGILVTQPFVFAKGSVITRNELNRYGVLEYSDRAWSRGQYTLTVEIQSIDGVSNNVSVNAKVEGRAGNGIMSEWITVRSSGVAEDEFLAKLVEMVTGNSVEPTQDIPKSE